MMESQDNLYNTHPDLVVIYTAKWCPDCERVLGMLNSHAIKYLEVDTARDPKAGEFLEQILRRVRLPTVFFPDGTMSVEPSNEEIARHLPK